MIEAPLRLSVSWLTDAVTGVNAQLPNVPRPVGELAPPAVLIYNELDHPWVARNVIHRDALKDEAGPRAGLIIRFPNLDPESAVRHPVLPQHIQNGGVLTPVLVEYARRKLVNAAQPANHSALVLEARQTMRTVARVVAQRFDHDFRTYDQDECDVGMDAGGITFAGGYVDHGDDEVLDQLILPFVVLDRWMLQDPQP